MWVSVHINMTDILLNVLQYVPFCFVNCKWIRPGQVCLNCECVHQRQIEFRCSYQGTALPLPSQSTGHVIDRSLGPEPVISLSSLVEMELFALFLFWLLTFTLISEACKNMLPPMGLVVCLWQTYCRKNTFPKTFGSSIHLLSLPCRDAISACEVVFQWIIQ